MKRTTFLIILMLYTYSLPAQGQGIHIASADMTIEQAFKLIEKQTPYSIAFNRSKFDCSRRISVRLENASIEKTMAEILMHTGFGYRINGHHIVITENKSKPFTISGYLNDSQTTESLIGVAVYDQRTMAGTTTNQYGFYSITLPGNEVDLAFSYVGYQPQIASFFLERDTSIDVRLTGSLNLKEVEITASRVDRIQERTQAGVVNIPIVQIKSLPVLGETDVLKALQLLPGVQSGGEGTSGLYVRGGGPDQNLILLDGVPLYNASHLFGFLSVFNADAINYMELFKGGFPARYGGRVSSVVDISMKEGNMQQFHGEVAAGLVSAKMTFEGPVVRDRTSFILSARRSYIDLLLKPYFALQNRKSDDQYSMGYYFHDVTAKINHRFSTKDRIYLSFYLGNDDFHAKTDFRESNTLINRYNSQLTWGNTITAFRWNHIFTPKLFGNTTLTYSRYRFRTGMESWNTHEKRDAASSDYYSITDHYASKYRSGIRDWSGKVSFDYLPSPNHYVRFGASATYHTFNPGALAYAAVETAENFGKGDIHSWEYSAYAEDDMKITDRLKTNIGLHWSGFAVQGLFYREWQPRVSVCYLLTGQISAKASYSRMAQYIQLLTNSTVGLPTDLWVPSTSRLQPQTSHQVAAGLVSNFREEYEVSLEGYYKTMEHVLEYKEGASFLNPDNDWESRVLQGEGRSYGIELFARKKTGSLTGWVGYTLSWTDRQFDELNQGNRFRYKYDRRHDISLVVIKRFGKNIELSGTWVFGSGNCISMPVNVYRMSQPLYNDNGRYSEYYDFGERNGYRMKPYHRLDLGVSFIKQKRWGERRWVISLYNAYSHRNPFYVDVRFKEKALDQHYRKYEYVQYSLFPIIPSISYQFKF